MTIPLRKLLAATFLFSSSFAWFYAIYMSYYDIFSVFATVSPWRDVGSLLFLVSVAISAFIGSVIAGRVDRRKLLFSWLVFGILAMIPLPLFRGVEPLIFFSILGGAAFGVGFPSCMAFLAESTTSEERGRVCGFVILATFFLVFFSIFLNSALGYAGSLEHAPQPFGIILTAVLIKSIGFLSFIFDPLKKERREVKSWRRLLSGRDFVFYTIAYILFNIAAGLVAFIWQNLPPNVDYEAITRIGELIRYLGLGVFGVAAGVIADLVGRKRPVVLGLIMLGAGYTLIGLITNETTYLINFVLSGFAWGIIIVLYLIIPGDLAFSGSEERFYAAGWILPFIIYIGIYGSATLFEIKMPVEVFSAILSIIIFSSIIPIWAANETLSERKIRERRYREYTEKVGKVLQESRESG